MAGPASGTCVGSTGYPIDYFDGIADGIDVRVFGPHMAIDANPAARSDREPGLDRQAILRPNAHAEHDDVGFE